MVPNQSVVLYSRLHLVSRNTTVLATVRWVIIASFFCVAIPTVLTNIVAAYKPGQYNWSRAFQVIERFQVAWFAAQECSISAIYIWETIGLIRLSPEDKHRSKILYELLAINIAAIVMDSALVILEYLGFYFAQVVLKATVYSIKLKLEFAVLGMLVSLVHSHGSELSQSSPTWRMTHSVK